MTMVFAVPQIVCAQSQALDVHTSDTSHPVKLELKLLNQQTRVSGPQFISSQAKEGAMSIVESVYTIRARAFGGDVYLPAYQEQIIFEPVFTYPDIGSNAVVPGTPTITLAKQLDKKGDRYILKEYQEVDMQVAVSFKVIHSSIADRIIFKSKLNTLSWFPTVYKNGSFDGGVDEVSGGRLVHIPLINATYIPEQITRVNWESEPVIFVKSRTYIEGVRKNIKLDQQASVLQIFSRLFRLGK